MTRTAAPSGLRGGSAHGSFVRQGGGQPESDPLSAFVVRDGERYSAEGVAPTPDDTPLGLRGGSVQENEPRRCALEDCSEPVEPRKRGGSPKRFCSERCQRIAERRRYRARHTERTVCQRRGCGVVFDRSTTTNRPQVYCSPQCMAEARSVEYAGRPDILAGAARARAAARREGRA